MRALQAVTMAVWMGAAVSSFAAEKIFDPGANAAKDLKVAERKAAGKHKNILLDVGGNWCPWCLLVDKTLHDDAELNGLLEKNYVVLRVNFSKENENKDFLSAYPKAAGYPQWYVLGSDGALLKTEDTSQLEATHKLAQGYNRDALKAFLMENAPKS
jgi:thiol:disulfide interchange protein